MPIVIRKLVLKGDFVPIVVYMICVFIRWTEKLIVNFLFVYIDERKFERV